MQIDVESSCINHEKLCHNIVGCVGFNSKGYLKDRLLPYTNWTHSSSEESKEYFVYFPFFILIARIFFEYISCNIIDLDYSINSGKPYCPQNTSCTSFTGLYL